MTAPASAADAAREAAAHEAALFYGRRCPEYNMATRSGPANPSQLRELIDAIAPVSINLARTPARSAAAARRAPRTAVPLPTITSGLCDAAECSHPMRIHDIAGCRRAGCSCSVSAVA